MSKGGHTGHGISVSLVTSGFSLNIVDVQPPSFEGSMVERPGVSVPVDGVVPVDPGDTLTAGEIVVTVEDDESYDPPFHERQDVVITYPAPPGMTNGQVDTYANAFVYKYERPTWQTGERRLATMTIKVNDKPTTVAAS